MRGGGGLKETAINAVLNDFLVSLLRAPPQRGSRKYIKEIEFDEETFCFESEDTSSKYAYGPNSPLYTLIAYNKDDSTQRTPIYIVNRNSSN